MALHVSYRSSNRKTGPVTATYRTGDTCPPSCAFFDASKGGPGVACYAGSGPGGGPVAIARKHGRVESDVLADMTATVSTDGTVRHHVVGDIMRVASDGRRIVDTGYIRRLARFAHDRPDVSHILYTHAWDRTDATRFPFPVNASCETSDDIVRATDAGYMAVVTVPNEQDPMIGSRIAGRRVVRCPAEVADDVTCSTCRLCAKGDRVQGGRDVLRPVVAFVAHGTGKRIAGKAIGIRRKGKGVYTVWPIGGITR